MRLLYSSIRFEERVFTLQYFSSLACDLKLFCHGQDGIFTPTVRFGRLLKSSDSQIASSPDLAIPSKALQTPPYRIL